MILAIDFWLLSSKLSGFKTNHTFISGDIIYAEEDAVLYPIGDIDPRINYKKDGTAMVEKVVQEGRLSRMILGGLTAFGGVIVSALSPHNRKKKKVKINGNDVVGSIDVDEL